MSTGPKDIEPATEQARLTPGPAKRSGREAAADIERYFQTAGLREGDKLPAEATLREHFGLSAYTLREALAELRSTGAVVTVNGKGSFIGHAAARPAVIRDPANPYRDLTPIRANDLRFPANAETATAFDIAPRTRLYVKEEVCEHRVTGVLVSLVRKVPMPVLFNIEPAPDPYGDRADLTTALADHYGNLHYRTTYRVVLNPAPEIRAALDLPPAAPVIEHRIMTCTTTGRVLMTETDTTAAASGQWEQI
ncbi:MAG TPA: GntR family transcriptional regulator [Actinospica sp.]|nr:GntR family transcriptional regulator [Actinospica sp.]